MIMKKKFIQASFLIAVLFAILSSCKKYPENKLWFKRPSDALISHWNLEQMTVNGVDSTGYDDVKMYVEKGFDMQDEDFVFLEQYEGGWKLDKKKKFITINATASFGPPTFYGAQKNLFRDNQTWKIEKLSKSQFWISVTNGSSGYLLKFKN
jgi:hypothetical protein